MDTRKKAVFNWSGGKDSSLALYKILREDAYEVVALLTALDAGTRTSSIHAIPLDILQAQADSIGIPLYPVMLPPEDGAGYDKAMEDAVLHFKNGGVRHFIFGDIHLHDIKTYREARLNPHGIEVVEPLWDKTPEEVLEEFFASGIRTRIIVTQADKLDKTYVGRELDRSLAASFPGDVDVCGENGEYHTLSYDGPLFRKKVVFLLGAPRSVSYDIGLDDGSTKTCRYWQADVTAPPPS